MLPTGSTAFDPALVASPGVYTITFPAGTFASPPIVVVSPFGTTSALHVVKVTTSNVSSGTAVVTVNVHSASGALTNGAFSFVAVAG